jgi:hypothetical protein
MSERMIELHRARLLAAGKGSKSSSGGAIAPPLHQQNGSQSTTLPHYTSNNIPQTLQQFAVATMQAEDSQLKRFLQRLQHERDDSQQGEALLGPTVPTALSRRMLHRQGAGYYDGTVAAITSAAADRFLATVLQQAVACRDQRLKGVEIARQSTRKRKRHKRQYQESVDDRRRRKEERAAYRESVNLAAIAAADELQQKPSLNRQGQLDSNITDDSGVATSSPPKSKKKKKATDAPTTNGYKKRPSDLSDDEVSYDSIDEEEEYYEQYYSNDDNSSEEDDEDEDETMILRDLIRPLEAWDYHMNGKMETDVATLPKEDESNSENDSSTDEIENDDEDIMDDGYTDAMSMDVVENGFSNDAATKLTVATSKKSPSKSPDEKQNTSAKMSLDSQPSTTAHGGATT